MKRGEDLGPWAGRPRAQMMKSDEVEAILHLRELGWCSRPRGTGQFRTRVDPKMLWWPGHRPTHSFGVRGAVVKARRSAPPPLRGALGLDDGSAHACPDWLLSDDAQL